MIEDRYIKILKEIALLGAIDREIPLSSFQLSKIIGCSQQSASRYLIDMEKRGYIERKIGIKKQRIKITEKGKGVLEKEYLDYKRIFSKEKRILLRGRVVSGLGEGKYYTNVEGYTKQFIKKLGFKPVPGTLNVRISREHTERLKELLEFEGIEIKGFSTKDRSFGGAKCFRAKINNEEAIAILPIRSHYTDILEFIAPYKLRERLNLKDGDPVSIVIDLGDKDEKSGDS